MRRSRELAETNPMLGHRGCRLGVSFPEIYEMQVRAIIEAALEVSASGEAEPRAEIMHPLVAKGEEMKFLRELTDRVAGEGRWPNRVARIEYLVGTMIELPRAAICAGDLANSAEFFSFGTNDLTQTTFGISRDDSGRFLNAYIDKGIFERDPFVTIDQEGVGDLIRIAAERGRAVRPNVKLGICGEHGGDPASIAFCESDGTGLRLLLRLSRADRPARGRPGGDRRAREGTGRLILSRRGGTTVGQRADGGEGGPQAQRIDWRYRLGDWGSPPPPPALPRLAPGRRAVPSLPRAAGKGSCIFVT